MSESSNGKVHPSQKLGDLTELLAILTAEPVVTDTRLKQIVQIIQESVKRGTINRTQAIGMLDTVIQTYANDGLPKNARRLYPSTEAAIANVFELPLDDLQPLKSALEQLHKREERPVVVIDLLSGPEMIKSLKKRGAPPGLYIAVGLGEDLRSQAEIEEDVRNGIHYIRGDINNKETWEEMNRTLSGFKADFVLCDAGGGMIDAFGHDAKKLEDFIRRSIGVLNENGHLAIDYCVNPSIESSGLNTLSESASVIKEPDFGSGDYTIVVKKSE